MPRQPSRSINIVTAEELPVLTSPRSAKTIERRKRHKPDTQVTSRNPFHEETKPHLTKQSYPRTRVNSIKRQGCFHFQPEEMHPLESIMMREAKLSVLFKLLHCAELLSEHWWKLHVWTLFFKKRERRQQGFCFAQTRCRMMFSQRQLHWRLPVRANLWMRILQILYH